MDAGSPVGIMSFISLCLSVLAIPLIMKVSLLPLRIRGWGNLALAAYQFVLSGLYFYQIEMGRNTLVCIFCGILWLIGTISQLSMYRFNQRMLENDKALEAQREEVSLLSQARQVE